MFDLELILRLFGAALSFSGYSVFLTKRWGIHPLISPAVVIPAIGVVMVLAGIINMMSLFVYIIWILGIGLLIYTLVLNKGFQGLLHPALILLLLALAWLMWRLQGAQVYSIDNFHHWLKVLKVLLAHDMLPTFRTPFVTFQAYPTGSASYLYYVLKLTGYREDLAIVLQLMMLLVFCMPLFALPKKGKWLSWVVLAGALVVTLSRLYERDTMLVDDLQAFIGISAIAIAYYLRDNLNKALICLAPISIFTVLIKNSAFFFVGMTTLFLLLALQDKQRWGRAKVVLINIVLPSLVFYLWTRHVALVFDNGLGHGMQAKHALNLSAYYSQAKDWGLSRIPELTGRVFEQAFGLQYFPGTLAFVSTAAACLLIIPLLLKKKVREAVISLLLLAFAWISYALWEAGIVGMFAFSMPWGETDTLACGERYMMTGIVYMFGLMVLSVVESVNAWPSSDYAASKIGSIALALLCAFLPVRFSGFPGQWGAPIQNISVRSYFAALKEKYPVYFGEGGIFITDRENQYYLINKYMQTDFLTEKVLPVVTSEFNSPEEVVQIAVDYAPEYGFLIVETDNEKIMDGLSLAMDKGVFYHMKVFLFMDAVIQ